MVNHMKDFHITGNVIRKKGTLGREYIEKNLLSPFVKNLMSKYRTLKTEDKKKELITTFIKKHSELRHVKKEVFKKYFDEKYVKKGGKIIISANPSKADMIRMLMDARIRKSSSKKLSSTAATKKKPKTRPKISGAPPTAIKGKHEITGYHIKGSHIKGKHEITGYHIIKGKHEIKGSHNIKGRKSQTKGKAKNKTRKRKQTGTSSRSSKPKTKKSRAVPIAAATGAAAGAAAGVLLGAVGMKAIQDRTNKKESDDSNSYLLEPS